MITIPAPLITWFNVVLLVFYALFVINGFRRGFLRQILAMIGTVLSYLAAWRYSPIGAAYFHIWPKSWTPTIGPLPKEWIYPLANHIAWFFLILLVCRLLFALLEKLAKGAQNIPVLKQVSALLGGVLGAGTATIWVLVICFALYTPLFKNGDMLYEKTALHTIHDTTAVVFNWLGRPVNEMMDNHILFKMIDEHKDDDQKWIMQWLQEHGFEPENGETK